MKRKQPILLLCFLLTVSGCKEKYLAHTSYPYTGYLVVEGFINARSGESTQIRISRTTSLDTSFYRAEPGDAVTVESSDNQSWPLESDGSGGYSGPVPVNPALQYRLRIGSGNDNFISDFVAARITPVIDSVHWEEQAEGVQIDVSSHDPAGQTIFYKWGFAETWKYNARYLSQMIFENGSLQYRTDDQQVYYCWKTDTASTILLASTEKLSADVVANQPLTFIPFSTPFNKLITKYSILVTEAALTREEYEWYDRLKKNTENLGSIFDAQPSEITGNIHSLSDTTEPVIGYIGCRTQTTQRIFISRGQLKVKSLSSGDEFCRVDTIRNLDNEVLGGLFGGNGSYQPISYIYQGRSLIGLGASSAECVDCRVKGGVLTKPSFWID